MRNKGQGFLVSAVVAAGLLLRPVGSPAPQPNGSSQAGNAPSSQAKPTEVEGPWIASCNYWAAVRDPTANWEARDPQVHDTLDAANGRVDLHINLDATSKGKELGCRADAAHRWGFPVNGPRINATAIIVTVPDPVHTHLALTFDRVVDSILQAASDNGYVSSYYWLPWKNRLGSANSSDSPDAEPGHDAARERKPGLIILKYVPTGSAYSADSYYDVIYLFLVAETPTQGVDGFQLQNALSYEMELGALLKEPVNHFSTGSGRVAMIGPLYSGSAASLRAGIDAAYRRNAGFSDFEVTGATGTSVPVNQLTPDTASVGPNIRYLSFDDDRDYATGKFLSGLLPASGRVTLLIEDNSTLANATLSTAYSKGYDLEVISFPREISLLRNAQISEGQTGNEAVPSGSVPSPYLRFSLKDSSLQDSVPQFSARNTPLSQEAELMSIGREVHRFRSQFIAIVASNVLDQIFLAQFLHRACPDARLVFFGADLLMVREVDNVPYIGSITISPYALIGLASSRRAYPNSSSQAFYNAVSYTLWRNLPGNRLSKSHQPILQGYRSLLEPPTVLQPSLWATAIGSDGYYPLAIISPCASVDARIMPAVLEDGSAQRESCEALGSDQRRYPLSPRPIHPARLWAVLCTLICLACSVHAGALLAATYRSQGTRDLAVRDNDQPHRRSTCIHVATAALISMLFVVSFPLFALARVTLTSPLGRFATVVALCVGVGAILVTFFKTWGYSGWAKGAGKLSPTRTRFHRAYGRLCGNAYFFLNVLTWTAAIILLSTWAYLCITDGTGSAAGGAVNLVGLSFSYRCINPGSGVSPVVPVLLLLVSWYLWALLQTWRLRFSDTARPWLPEKVDDRLDARMFVSDEDLRAVGGPRDCGLYKNLTCLLITRQMLCRFWKFRKAGTRTGEGRLRDVARIGGQAVPDDCIGIDLALAVIFAALLVWFALFTPIRSLDRFLWRTGGFVSTPYEFLLGGLFLPLLVVSVTGWLRMILVWGALRRGLLERLENQPIRFAFSRLKVMGWMAMLRHGGVQEQHQDMARSLESIRQMLNQTDLTENLHPADLAQLNCVHERLLAEVRFLLGGPKTHRTEEPNVYGSVNTIERDLAAFSHQLLKALLIPYWKTVRTGLVASEDTEDLPIKARRSETPVEHPAVPMALHAGPAATELPRILVAEEFLAIRYLSMIRAVLANMRHQMTFVSISFVLAMVAWNSYPFQPRQWVDWLFTGLLFFLGWGMIWVFAQMHRNPILSRITDTKANELGWDFYLRIVSFGAVPFLAWLTYQFPDVGGLVYKFLQPGVPVIK